MSKQEPIYDLIECETADKFLETLRLSNTPWRENGGDTDQPWIFRGHGDANYQLVPSRFRPQENETNELEDEISTHDKIKHIYEAFKKKIEANNIYVQDCKSRDQIKLELARDIKKNMGSMLSYILLERNCIEQFTIESIKNRLPINVKTPFGRWNKNQRNFTMTHLNGIFSSQQHY